MSHPSPWIFNYCVSILSNKLLIQSDLTFDGFSPQNRDRGLLVGDAINMIGSVGVNPNDGRLLQVFVTQTVPYTSTGDHLNPAQIRGDQPNTQIS